MKIFRFVFSAFLAAALLVGCSKKPDEAGEGASGYSDGYLYSAHSGVLYKYNLQTGIALPLCEDPVCTHSGKSCPFYGVNTDIFEVGEFIYYIRDGEMFRYDRSTSRAEDLCKLPGTVYYPFCAFNRIYYSSFIYGMEDGELFTSADVWAYDIQSGSTQKLNTEKLYDLQKAEFVQDGWLVWYDSQTQKHYTTDADYRNRSEMDGSLFVIWVNEEAKRCM